MIRGLYIRLKCTTFIILLSMSGGMTGCSAWFHTIAYDRHNVYSGQKEKTSIPRHRQYKKTSHYAHIEGFWDSLQKEFILIHYTKKPAVQAQIYHFLQRPYQLCRTISFAAPYIHYIHEQVKQRHLPGELILLPLIESTYNPLAVNTVSGASGLWQLTPRTAQKFGVRQDAMFDGKRDLYTSTHAALDYLTYLNQLFCGNWLLTLAAYDTGEGNVKRAVNYNIVRNLSTSFWDLPLALETTSYVPKLLALSAIINNPTKYGLELPVIHTQPYLESIEVRAGVSMIHAAALANISIKKLKQFNPGFKQLAFIPQQSYRLLLPTTCVAIFKRNLAEVSRQSSSLKLLYYQVKPGDTLSSIAKHYHITIDQLRLWNGLKKNQVLPRNKSLVIMKMTFPSASYI
jgi:membrane-bound lytic murein transglycosylase D